MSAGSGVCCKCKLHVMCIEAGVTLHVRTLTHDGMTEPTERHEGQCGWKGLLLPGFCSEGAGGFPEHGGAEAARLRSVCGGGAGVWRWARWSEKQGASAVVGFCSSQGTQVEGGRRGVARSSGSGRVMMLRGRPHGKGAGLRPRSSKRSRVEEEATQQPRPKLARQASDERSKQLATEASDGPGVQLLRADSFADLKQNATTVRSHLSSPVFNRVRATLPVAVVTDSMHDVVGDAQAAESIEWEGALLSPLTDRAKDGGVSGAVSVSLMRTRSQGLRECELWFSFPASKDRATAGRTHPVVLPITGEAGSVRKQEDTDFEGTERMPVSDAVSSPSAASSSDTSAPGSTGEPTIISPLTFKADESTPSIEPTPPPPPRLSTVLSGV